MAPTFCAARWGVGMWGGRRRESLPQGRKGLPHIPAMSDTALVQTLDVLSHFSPSACLTHLLLGNPLHLKVLLITVAKTTTSTTTSKNSQRWECP